MISLEYKMPDNNHLKVKLTIRIAHAADTILVCLELCCHDNLDSLFHANDLWLYIAMNPKGHSHTRLYGTVLKQSINWNSQNIVQFTSSFACNSCTIDQVNKKTTPCLFVSNNSVLLLTDHVT